MRLALDDERIELASDVVLGLLINAWLLVRIAGGLTPYRVTGVRAAALYWYVVAAVGVFVVATQVSPS